MIDYIEELKYNKRERDRINSEINDLESRIIVEGGRNNRFEVNNCRNRVNRLKMRLNEVLLKIADLEKMIDKTGSKGQIQIVPNRNPDLPAINNGEITITDTLKFDKHSDMSGEVIQTVNRTIERKIVYKNGQPVSCIESVNEITTTRKLSNNDEIFIKSSVVE